MKKIVIFIVVQFASIGILFGEHAVDSTRSMDSDHLSVIRSDFNGGDIVASYYWDRFISTNPTELDTVYDETEEGWQDFFNSDIYVKHAIRGAVGLDIPGNSTDSTYLDKAKAYLLDPNNQYEDYLNLDEVWDKLNSDKDAGVNPWYRIVTRNTALMVDMLWNYVDSADSVAMCAKLDSLADSLYYHLDRLKTTWGLGEKPRFFTIAPDASALGYAGCILGDTLFINTAKNMIFEYQVPYVKDQQNGYLDLVTTNEYFIGEGTTYFGCNVYSQLAFFYTANLRMNDENLYNEDIINNTIESLQNMIAPDMQGIPLDDCYYLFSSSGVELNSMFIDGLFEYYYNNTNGNSDNWLRWYFNEYRDKWCYGDNYPSLKIWSRYIYPIFSYNPYKTTSINGSYFMPSEITGTTHSGDELTTFRSEISDQDDFENSISMYVNYDNALDPNFHEHSDQSSFQLFGFDKYLLIDTGYKSSYYDNWANNAIHWHHSPYAHNLIIVNPDSSKEYTHLDHHFTGDPNTIDSLSSSYPLINDSTGKYWEPRYRDVVNPNNPQTVKCPNPTYKNFFVHNNSIEQLSIYLDYEDDPTSNDTIRVTRNYYFIDDEYFIIIDDVENLNQSSDSTNLYWNQLHFKPYTSSNENVTINGSNIFTLDAGNNAYLYGTIGATSSFYNVIEEKLPWGGEQSKTRKHQRIRSVVDDNETSYITLLIPSESATNPITDIIDGDTYYAVEIYDTSKQPIEKSYYAVSDSLLDVSFTDIDINSDAGFVGLTYRPGYQYTTKITQFIMAGGDSLLYNDSTVVQCSNVDEIIANYSGIELSVVVKSDDEYPKYKILRQGVALEDFTSIGVENGENGTSNIGSIWYDDDYFYVNWFDFSSSPLYLTTSISVPEGDCLEIGNNVIVNCMNPEVNIEVYGDIIIGENVTFTSPSYVAWDGLYLFNSEGEYEITELTFENGIMSNESYLLDISNSEFNNAAIEQFGNKLYIYHTDFDSSNVICSFSGSGGKIGDPDDVEINIDDCSFINYLGYPIYITGYDIYELSNNTITDCNGGIKLYYSGHPRKCIIYNNTIQDNIYGNGIQIFNSQADIIGNNLITGNSYGIVGANNSSISILGNETYPLQMIYDNIYEEIVVDHRSFPENITCNKIYDDNFQYGTSDQYLIRCANFEGDERDLDAQNNYWGLESLEWGEWDGDYRFDPSTAFDYIPVWDPGTPRDGDLEGAALLYAEADSLIEEEAYEEAKLLFKSIIDIYPYTEYALYSMRNLLPLETTSGQDYYTLQQYLLTDPKCNIDQIHTKLSNHLANFCSIKMEQYPEAISFFEDIITNPETTLDSVYAVIDVGYTYLLMDNGGKSEYVGKIPQLKPKSIKEYRETSEDLLSMVFNLREVESNVINQDYKFVLNPNFPNPFGNSTLISFSLPLSTQKADLKIYNIRGQLVKELIIGNKPGIDSITWDGRDNHGKRVGSGIYFYKLSADKQETIKKMVIIR